MTDRIDGGTAHAWIVEFHSRFTEHQDYLTNLDRLAGDGDFGGNIASALERTQSALPSESDATYGTVFGAASRGFMATGGTSGPLFGMWFREIAKAGSEDGASLDDVSRGISNGLATIQKLGGAKVGDNTMIDALFPAAESLESASSSSANLKDALVNAAHAARRGAESTSGLIAHKGRASYVGELARGVLDPGAVTIALFFEAGANAVGAETNWAPVGSLAD